MGEAIQQDNIASRLSDLERRLDIMEKTSRNIRSSVQDGSFSVLDATGAERVTLGRLSNGQYGIEILSADGTQSVLYADVHGMDMPQFSIPQNFYADPGTPFMTITSGSGWRLVSRSIFTILAHDAVRFVAGFGYTDTTTTGQFRLTANRWHDGLGALYTTASPVLPANLNGSGAVNWLHQLPMGIDPGNEFFYHLDLEAQVVSGAGSILCYEPVATMQNGRLHGATTAGVWQIF